MALDEPSENDETFAVEGLQFIIGDVDQAVVKKYGGVVVDYGEFYGMGRFSVYVSRGGRC